MMSLFFDTETTGLPDMKAPRDAPQQPHLVQIAAILADDDSGLEYGSMSCIIRPDGWVIPADMVAVHGITTEMALACGVSLRRAMLLFTELYHAADQLVAHNLPFDDKMLRICFERLQAAYPPPTKTIDRTFCTASKSTKIVNLPPSEKMAAKNMKMPKTPNLTEAYEFFIGPMGDGAHAAKFDARACQQIYYAILAHGRGEGTLPAAATTAAAVVRPALPVQAATPALVRPAPPPARETAPADAAGEFDPNDPFGDGR